MQSLRMSMFYRHSRILENGKYTDTANSLHGLQNLLYNNEHDERAIEVLTSEETTVSSIGPAYYSAHLYRVYRYQIRTGSFINFALHFFD